MFYFGSIVKFTTYLTTRIRFISCIRANRFPLTIENLNSRIKHVEYAVRGPIPSRALEIESELLSNPRSHPFDQLIYVNIGDPQNLGQLPLTFPRQLLALCAYPPLISQDNSDSFPDDVKQRARYILKNIGSFGGYSHSLGFPFVRKNIMKFLDKRDNISVDSTIILSDGASEIINVILSCLCGEPDSLVGGVMIPIPQYPLYTASLAYLGLKPIPYYLHEESCWGLYINDLHNSLKSYTDTCKPKAFVVINPGNPTGQCLNVEQQVEILKFCNQYDLLLLADEVYQDNIHDVGARWHSFRKTLVENQVLIVLYYLIYYFFLFDVFL